MSYKFKIILLSFGHGLNDLIAGYFLGSFATQNSDLFEVGLAITAYNILAFGGQYPVAVLLEKITETKKALILSYILNVFAAGLFLFAPIPAIIIAGIASAIYHVAGGSYCANDNKAVNIGLFAAPGIAGLITGGYLAWSQYKIIPFLLPAAIIFLFILFKINFTKSIAEKSATAINNKNHRLDSHDMIMILLLLVISLRSVTWNVFQLIHENDFEWLFAIAGAAVAGKIAGGWIADRIGWRLYAMLSTIIATPLLTLFKKEMLLFCIGIGILQSGIPATTSLLIHSLKGRTSVGVSLSFGIAIIIGAAANVFSTQQILLHTPNLLLISVFMLLVCSVWYKRIAQSPI